MVLLPPPPASPSAGPHDAPPLLASPSPRPAGPGLPLHPAPLAHMATLDLDSLSREVSALRWIGQGGGGTVFLGVWQSAPVAVKLMLADTPAIADRAALEGFLSSVVGHPNVVRTYCFEVTRLSAHSLQEPGYPHQGQAPAGGGGAWRLAQLRGPHPAHDPLDSLLGSGPCAASLSQHSPADLQGQQCGARPPWPAAGASSALLPEPWRSAAAATSGLDAGAACSLGHQDTFQSDDGFGDPEALPGGGGRGGRGGWSVRQALAAMRARPGQYLTHIIMEHCDRGSLLSALKRGVFRSPPPPPPPPPACALPPAHIPASPYTGIYVAASSSGSGDGGPTAVTHPTAAPAPGGGGRVLAIAAAAAAAAAAAPAAEGPAAPARCAESAPMPPALQGAGAAAGGCLASAASPFTAACALSAPLAGLPAAAAAAAASAAQAAGGGAPRFSRRIVLRAVLRTARDIAQGMSHLHASGIIHGDLKPGNVLLRSCRADRRGFTALVADFGLAKVTRSDQPLEVDEWSTVSYMAPEAIHGRWLKASDVFSFGVLLWQLATGATLPYAGLTAPQITFGVSEGKLKPEWPAAAHPSLARLGRACTATCPEHRPSFEAIIKVLTRIEQQVREELRAQREAERAAAQAAAQQQYLSQQQQVQVQGFASGMGGASESGSMAPLLPCGAPGGSASAVLVKLRLS